MRVPRLFVELPLVSDTVVELPPSQAHYVRNVLRARAGQPITVFNGDGGEYHGRIAKVERSGVQVELRAFDADDRISTLIVHMGLGVTKRDAMDEAIRKSTELGVAVITPVLTEYNATSVKSLEKRQQHWRGVAISAAEQCERNRVPIVHAPMSLPQFIETATADVKLIAHPGASDNWQAAAAPGEVVILAGPEGGFSHEEVEAATAAGYLRATLGPRILRAETAPLVLLALVQARWGDLLSAPSRRPAEQ